MLQLLMKRERLVLLASLAILWVLAWAWLVTGAGMDDQEAMPMDGMAMAGMEHGPASTAIVFAMWWVMMVAMMLPSAAPAILLYQRIYEQALARDTAAQHAAPAPVFAAGYLLVWLGFSMLASLVQVWLGSLGFVSADRMALTNGWASGSVLILAGAYQLSPLKHACLAHCRSPAIYFVNYWRPGWSGALLLGIRHGLFCLGCCWSLMLLLFVFGVMNMLWIALLSLFVLAEKLIPGGLLIGRISGGLMIAAGAASLAIAGLGG